MKGLRWTIGYGGVIPDEYVKKLQKLGIKAVFGPGSSIASILAFSRKHLK